MSRAESESSTSSKRSTYTYRHRVTNKNPRYTRKMTPAKNDPEAVFSEKGVLSVLRWSMQPQSRKILEAQNCPRSLVTGNLPYYRNSLWNASTKPRSPRPTPWAPCPLQVTKDHWPPSIAPKDKQETEADHPQCWLTDLSRIASTNAQLQLHVRPPAPPPHLHHHQQHQHGYDHSNAAKVYKRGDVRANTLSCSTCLAVPFEVCTLLSSITRTTAPAAAATATATAATTTWH